MPITQIVMCAALGSLGTSDVSSSGTAPPSATLGAVQVVRRSGVVNCGPALPPPHVPGQPGDLDIPDAPSRAWFSPRGGARDHITLLATHTAARYDRGATLQGSGRLQHDCAPVFNSTWNADPSLFDDRTWLMSPWFPPGATPTTRVYALAHMEFHGYADVVGHALCVNQTTGRPYTRSPEPQSCWYNAIVLLASSDGGRTFRHAAPPPAHLVAAAPYKYAQGTAIGYGDMSNVLLHRDDGFLYVFANSRGDYRAMKKGHCLMRTQAERVGDPGSWRGWGGEGRGFNVSFVNPYHGPVADPAAHVCEPLDIAFGPHFIGWSTFYARYIAIGETQFTHPNGTRVPGLSFAFSLSRDLLHWSPPAFIKQAGDGGGVKEAYPSLLDEDASRGHGSNLDRVGQDSGFLYYMHSHDCNLTNFKCRDIWRQPIAFAGNESRSQDFI